MASDITRTCCDQACRRMAGLSLTDHYGVIKEMGKSRINMDENDVQKVYTSLANWRNPFLSSETDEICHLASGKTAPKQLEDDLLTAHDKGNEAMKTFIEKRLLKSEVPFHDTLPKMKLSTFASMKLSIVKIGGKQVILKAERDLFARLIVAGQTRETNLRDVFTYSLGPVPWSLASADGSLCKTVKSKLLEVLVDGVEPAEDVPPTAARIVDGMAILQSIKNVPATFEELAATIFHIVVPQRTLARRIDFITDTYPEISIKNPEREKRASQGTVRIKITGGQQKCPKQWKKFLSSGDNKKTLRRFLLEQWSKDNYADKIGSRKIYFTLEEYCFCLSVSDGKVLCPQNS